ncbi:hypothetical protein FJZ18_01645 [Candidatus Pacearchaeota archaeon]|nr:hypothetical protein [Candidatus Pacearchaeota archaeon]
MDEIKYKRKFDKIRSLKERLKIIRNISRKTSWITEGAWTSYAAPVYRNADLVVFLKIPEPRIYWRILKRYIRRRSDSTKYEKDTILTTLCIMRQVFRYFHKPKSFMTLQSHKECIDTYAKKYILLRNQKEINAFLDKVR